MLCCSIPTKSSCWICAQAVASSLLPADLSASLRASTNPNPAILPVVMEWFRTTVAVETAAQVRNSCPVNPASETRSELHMFSHVSLKRDMARCQPMGRPTATSSSFIACLKHAPPVSCTGTVWVGCMCENFDTDLTPNWLHFSTVGAFCSRKHCAQL